MIIAPDALCASEQKCRILRRHWWWGYAVTKAAGYWTGRGGAPDAWRAGGVDGCGSQVERA
jgi:hypothetical protein